MAMRFSSLFLIAWTAFFPATCFAAEKKVQAVFSTRNFLLNGKTPYVETYLLIRGNSVNFAKTASGQYQSSVEVLISISKNGKSAYTDRYNLLSPETSDSLGRTFNFIDQQRIPLDTGRYIIELAVKDLIAGTPAVEATDSIRIAKTEGISFSGIQWVESYSKTSKAGKLSKGGYDLVPRLLDYYGQGEDKLIVYAELYQSISAIPSGQRFLIRYGIEDERSGEILTSYSGFRRYPASEVAVFMQEFNIERLPGGQYKLVLEAVNQDNQVLARAEQNFTRSNPALVLSMEDIQDAVIGGSFAEQFKSKDTLAEYIRALYPISSVQERNFAANLISANDLQMMQQFFLRFWQNRDASQPADAWQRYAAEVAKVKHQFGTSIRRGYDTDRGRVYLQYGPPDNRTVSQHEPSAYPYEIWHYYKLGRQSNRRFVFYNPDLVTNDYTLIHSDALGEIMNDQWQLLLMKRDTQTKDIDATSPAQHFGTQIQQNYQSPR